MGWELMVELCGDGDERLLKDVHEPELILLSIPLEPDAYRMQHTIFQISLTKFTAVAQSV
jgi:hypothetical protein